MLATRIIPTLLHRGPQLVKGKQFKSWRSVGLAAQAVRVHQARGVDELILLDIGATPAKRGPDLALVEELSDVLFVPLTVGGGVRSVQDVQDLLNAGADKVAICTAAIPGQYRLLRECSDRFGCQAIVSVVEYRDDEFGPYVCTSHCATRSFYGSPFEHATAMEKAGAGEIMLASVTRDGMMTGYDIPLIRRIAGELEVPLIASGGCGTYQHMLEAIKAGASAVAAGAMFQFTDQTPRGAAEFLQQNGVEVRLENRQSA